MFILPISGQKNIPHMLTMHCGKSHKDLSSPQFFSMVFTYSSKYCQLKTSTLASSSAGVSVLFLAGVEYRGLLTGKRFLHSHDL